MDANELKAKFPDTYNAVREMGRVSAAEENAVKVTTARKEGYDAGVKEENSRIQAVEKLSVPGAESIINSNKFNSSFSAEQVSTLIIKGQQDEIAKIAASSGVDAAALAKKMKGVGSQTPSGTDDDNEMVSVASSISAGFNSRYSKK